MFFMLVKCYLFTHIVKASINPDTGKAFLGDSCNEFMVFSLPAPHKGSKEKKFRSSGKLEAPVHHLLDRHHRDCFTALGAMGLAYPGKEEPHVVIDLRDSADRRAGIPACSLLVNGNCRREPFNIVNIRFVHAPEKLPGVGRERFHVPPLPLGIYSVKRES